MNISSNFEGWYIFEFYANLTSHAMPSCNLAKTVHNKWLQALRNIGGDFYIAIVDDKIRAFVQFDNYYQYLKNNMGGTGPCKAWAKVAYGGS